MAKKGQYHHRNLAKKFQYVSRSFSLKMLCISDIEIAYKFFSQESKHFIFYFQIKSGTTRARVAFFEEL